MTAPEMSDAQIREELRRLVNAARNRFREDMKDTVALIEAQAGAYTSEEQARAPKVIEQLKAKMDDADAIYKQLFRFIDRAQ